MAKSTPAAAPKTPATSTKESKRVRLFKLLSKNPNGLNNAGIRANLETESIAAICRDEVQHGRLKIVASEGRGLHFTLSAKGKSDLDKGKVDDNAAPKADWKD